MIFDERNCRLGEGPLWHPLRAELFWFDIHAKILYSKAQVWHFDLTVSAAGWIDENTLLIASEIGLHRFDIATGALSDPIVAMEADNKITRSNDGRADPWGGFWIGTMGYKVEENAGAIYRFYQGDLRKLFSDINVSNSMCFTPDRAFAHYTDTITQQVMRVPLDPETGWPNAEAEVWLDLSDDGFNPDGAVVDTNGTFWVALWGAARVNGYAPDGTLIASHPVPALQPTCPAFGGPNLTDLYITSASSGILEDLGDNGKTFCLEGIAQGQEEHRIKL